MASIHFVTRGGVQEMDILIANLQSQLFKWPRTNLNVCECGQHKNLHGTDQIPCKEFKGRVEDFEVQGKLRPIQFWEYTVPVESVPEVMFYLKIKGTGDQVHDEFLKKVAWPYRKMIGLKPLPKYDEKKLIIQKRLIHTDFISLYGLGVKYDDIKDFPQWGYRQEGI